MNNITSNAISSNSNLYLNNYYSQGPAELSQYPQPSALPQDTFNQAAHEPMLDQMNQLRRQAVSGRTSIAANVTTNFPKASPSQTPVAPAKTEESETKKNNNGEKVGGAIGAGAGILAGGVTGAEVGAIGGTCIAGPLGAIIGGVGGAVIGGVVGGFTGLFCGKKVGALAD